MRFGLSICAITLDSGAEDNELFFTAVHQINHGGPDALSNPSQRVMIAALNLKAGKRSIDLGDRNTAFHFFQNGVTFLGEGSWATRYELSLNLLDAASDAASVLGNGTAVTMYTEQIFANAKCTEDKLNGEKNMDVMEYSCSASIFD